MFVTGRQNAGQASGGSLWRADAAQICETIALSLALSRAFVAGVGEGGVTAAARQRVSDLMTHRGKKGKGRSLDCRYFRLAKDCFSDCHNLTAVEGLLHEILHHFDR